MANQLKIRAIDEVVNRFSTAHKNPENVVLQCVAIPLITFGILGLVWSIPFPHFSFLGKFNGFVNWASFLIAFSIYYYYKLSPGLSYCALLMVFAYSALIVSLEKVGVGVGSAVSLVSVLCLVAGLIIQFIGYKFEGKSPALKDHFRFLLDGPLWLFYLIFKRTKVRY